jgi:CheY-like chemotaxis protein/anti-sigma regulatory factor (Ser/Thr protein kinase)
MSHELRTPLNAVIGFSEVLLDRLFGDLNERQEEYLQDIRRSGRHLLDLLNEILDLSKIEAGQMVLDPEPFSVSAQLDHALSLVRERAAQHAISLELEVDEGVGVVDADRLRFTQVVLNLVSNAVKFTPDGGRVTVAASQVGDELVVTVADTGAGVRPEDRERIFESFQQGARDTSRTEGTGLGLTLCRRIVELFGGSLWLESELGRGSTFGFSLPTRAAGRARPEPGVPAEGGALLIVDDDEASLDLMCAYLTGSGLDVDTVRDGVTALERIRRDRPDGVVLDIRLPRLDGWQVLSAMREDPGTADLPVVVVSIVDERRRGLDLGAQEYLLKPVSRAAFVEALRTAGILVDRPSEVSPS